MQSKSTTIYKLAITSLVPVCALAVMLLFFQVQSTLAAQANRLRVTTSSDGANRGSYSPSISADGRKVAFASNSDFFDQGILERQIEMWLYDTATMTVTRVTTSSDGANRNSSSPSLNADGTKIAFASDSDFLGQGILRERQLLSQYKRGWQKGGLCE